MFQRRPGLDGSSDGQANPNGRERRLEALLANLASRLAAEGELDCAAIEREHPDLMPELAEYLRDLHLLKAARDLAGSSARVDAGRNGWEETLAEELQVLRRALGQYEVFERVQYGGQGVVYRARQRGANRVVAIKVLLDGPLASERQRARFEREIELISRLRHPNIVTVYDSGVVRGRNFYAMEFVEGQSIDDYVVLHDLTPREIVRLIVKVCRGVHHAHQHGIIHRDLKPANILVDGQGEPRVFDFGLAKDLWADGDAGHTATGPGVGTLPYISPEQAGGLDGVADVRSDIYAIGLVLYELLTDLFPYPINDKPAAVRQAIISAEPMPLRKAVALGSADRAPGLETIDRDVETILAKALAKPKEERYQSAAALADDLERWLSGDAVSARGDSRLYRLRKTLRKHRVAVAFAAVVVAASAVSGVAVTASWLRVRAERDNARQAARVALDQFSLTLGDVEESVRPLPGGVAVRDRLITGMVERIPQLEALIKSDAELKAVLTRLREKQGDLALQQGRRAEAAQYYQTFLEGSLHAMQAGSEKDSVVADVLCAYRKLAEASDEPVPLLERGIALGEKVGNPDAAQPNTRYELCQIRLGFAEHLRNSGRHRDSLGQYDNALALCRLPEERSDRDMRWLRSEAEALAGKGLVLHKLGENALARAALAQALERRQAIVARVPADTEARFRLLLSYRHLGTLCRDAGDVEEAKRYLQMAAEQGELLAAMDPASTAWDQDRYSVHHKLGSLCLDTDDLQEATLHSQKAVAIADAWAARENTKGSRSTRLFALLLQGKVQRTCGVWDAAAQTYDEAAALAESLMNDDPQNPASIAQMVAARDGLAYARRSLGDLPSALAQRRRVCQLQRRLVERQPDVVEYAVNLVRSQYNLALVHRDLQTPEDRGAAARLLDEAAASLDELRSSGKLAGWEQRCEPLAARINAEQDKLRHAADAYARSLDGPDSGESERSVDGDQDD